MGEDDSNDEELGAGMTNLHFTEAPSGNIEQCPARATQSPNNEATAIDGNNSQLPRQILVDPHIPDNNAVVGAEASDDHRGRPSANISEHESSLETHEQRRMPATSATSRANKSHWQRRLATGSPPPLGSSDNDLATSVTNGANNSRIRQRSSTGSRPSLCASDSSAPTTASDYGS